MVDPVREFAGRTIDCVAVATGLLTPGSVAEKVGHAYRRHLLGDRTLRDLPEHPRFVFNASHVQSGALWRFSRPYMGDWCVGLVEDPAVLARVPLAEAVAASPRCRPRACMVLASLQLSAMACSVHE